jgi:hypothetical protein
MNRILYIILLALFIFLPANSQNRDTTKVKKQDETKEQVEQSEREKLQEQAREQIREQSGEQSGKLTHQRIQKRDMFVDSNGDGINDSVMRSGWMRIQKFRRGTGSSEVAGEHGMGPRAGSGFGQGQSEGEGPGSKQHRRKGGH